MYIFMTSRVSGHNFLRTENLFYKNYNLSQLKTVLKI